MPAPLSDRIERLIDATTIIDPHTHIRIGSPAAPDLASLMSYHWVRTELASVGMPAEDFGPSLPAEERVRRSLPYLKKMRNTAMAWCFRRILRDLYGMTGRDLDESNYREICELVAASGEDPAWPRRVLVERCGIGSFVTSLGNAADPGPIALPSPRFMLDAHYLFCPGVATDLEPYFNGRTTRGEYLDALTSILGELPDDLSRIDIGLKGWLDGVFRRGVRFTNTFIPIETRFRPGDRQAAERALRAGRSATEADLDQLIHSVSWSVLSWHHENRKAFQIAVGAEYFICGGKSIPRFQADWTSAMCKALHEFPDARFDLMVASDVLLHEVAVLCRQFPNIYSSGYWWHTFFPSTIEKTAALRFQIAPATKFCSFLCDAYYVEWTYGKLQVVKKALAAALARTVESGFLDEDDLPDLLRQTLHDTPRDLYDLE